MRFQSLRAKKLNVVKLGVPSVSFITISLKSCITFMGRSRGLNRPTKGGTKDKKLMLKRTAAATKMATRAQRIAALTSSDSKLRHLLL